MMNIIKSLLHFGYWINLNPEPFVKVAFYIVAGGLVFLLLAYLIVRLFAHFKLRRQNPPLNRIFLRVSRLIITTVIAGGVLFFLAYEQIYILSARFWWLVLIVCIIVWKVFIILDIVKRYPKEVSARLEKLRFEKYLPK